MKITRKQLRKLINEEISRTIEERADLDKISDEELLDGPEYASFKDECISQNPKLDSGSPVLQGMLATCIRNKAKKIRGSFGE